MTQAEPTGPHDRRRHDPRPLSRAAGTAWAWLTRSATASRTLCTAFGTKLVVWAGSDGALKVLDGYCRHMGGDLTQGTIKDGNVACPFHDWRWSGEGKCVADPLRQAGAAAGAHPVLDDAGAQRAAVRVERPGGQPARSRRRTSRRSTGYGTDAVEQLVLEHAGDRGLQLPRDHRQHVGHGALLLHPLRLPDVLQERLRRARRHPVHELAGSAGRVRAVELLRRGQHAGVRSVLLRAGVHDQLAEERLPRHRDRIGPDQLPLPDRHAPRSCCSTA